jgi:hypothetical protein
MPERCFGSRGDARNLDHDSDGRVECPFCHKRLKATPLDWIRRHNVPPTPATESEKETEG